MRRPSAPPNRLARVQSDAERAIEGMRRARRHGEPTMFDLHRRDADRLLAEADRLLDASGDKLLRQINGLIVFAAVAAVLANAAAAGWHLRDPVADALAAAILALLAATVVLRHRFVRELKRERKRR